MSSESSCCVVDAEVAHRYMDIGLAMRDYPETTDIHIFVYVSLCLHCLYTLEQNRRFLGSVEI